MQSLMSTYMEQSKAMFQQMQEQLQTQTRGIFTGFPFNPFQAMTGAVGRSPPEGDEARGQG